MPVVAGFAEWEAQVGAYARTWWLRREEPQVSVLRARPALRRALTEELAAGGGPVPSTRLYEYAAGMWEPGRAEEHRRLLAGLAPPAGLVEGRALYFLLGLPGSGKTTVLRRLAQSHAGGPGPVSDADEVRAALPEYRGGLGSGVLQPETAAVVYGVGGYPAGGGLQERVLTAAGTVMVDVIGDPAYLPASVVEQSRRGRRVFLLLTACPVEVCEERVMRRAVSGGRFVPPALVREKDGVPRRALDAALATGRVTGWAEVDSVGPARVVDGDGTFDGHVAGLAVPRS